ncbi:TPA: bifunctional folylpolyglutamate synthase/dihydrofolate synthase [Candidatus Marinimicrobia bacterium]|nr:MAG: Dihydrofolate synthase / Folylpolyglutamate synthase [Marinimicrobia bacterium 46_47]KUK93747.1 MAG: Dihydrofolate synthase / Folylpolyglutamate synthase [Marinimicrobia bacterium 46_43]HAE87858.1 bifunctional folylpolyglutamate synthase/dihydrofolate synthase [Candidatus Neomarinimicrobiota bacterium]HBY19132.1 bifunctional folylpolyglutamate synthase/dihydrofolate synthase [Candidatus Neomarinimicrobiota bacterium]
MKDYLNELYSRLGGQMKLGLERTLEFMEWLQHPERAFPAIHVAGTNGKGSVVALSEAILRHSSYLTGRFTSPHLVHFNERIRINGHSVSEDRIETLINQWRPWLDSHDISFFEITTGLAFYLFREAAVNAAVVETGLGGRLDSTNVLNPRVTVITSINRDHTRILGDTLDVIAAEKAGIIKDATPLVTCHHDPLVMAVLEDKAKEKKAPLHITQPEDYIRDVRLKPRGMSLCLQGTGEWVDTPLAGFHQLENFALAIKACEIFTEGVLTLSAIIKGLTTVRWKGRFELLSEKPLVYYDVAHNPAGVHCLKELVLNLYPNKPLTLVIGMLGDKETQEIVDILLPHAHACYLSPVHSHRSMTPEALDELAAVRQGTCVASSVQHAIQKALENSPDDGLILIYGSHYIAPEVYQTFSGASDPESQ